MTRILNAPSLSYNQVRNALINLGATDVFDWDMFPALWDAALAFNVDPVGVVAQSAHETGLGQFKGLIDARWRNTCGLKLRDPLIVPGATAANTEFPLCHATFATWSIGARAHVEHLVAYAGGTVADPVDPRYVWVAGKHRCIEFRDLSTRWAPSTTYGDKIEAMIDRIRSAAS